MLYAKESRAISAGRIDANPGAVAYCPQCDKQLIPKCGEINIWHWAHKAGECDTWKEPETQWHLDWKSLFQKDFVEVPIGEHRADVYNGKMTVEFQHSPIQVSDIQAREEFYDNMIWVLDAREFIENFRSFIAKPGKYRGNYYTFRWYHPRKTWLAATKPVFIDFNSAWLFHIKKIRHATEYIHNPDGCYLVKNLSTGEEARLNAQHKKHCYGDIVSFNGGAQRYKVIGPAETDFEYETPQVVGYGLFVDNIPLLDWIDSDGRSTQLEHTDVSCQVCHTQEHGKRYSAINVYEYFRRNHDHQKAIELTDKYVVPNNQRGMRHVICDNCYEGLT